MVTVNDVAREAGVSPMTVSRYNNQPDLLSPSTRAKVKKAIERLQYVPNAAARSLKRGETESLALVLVDITNPFYTTVARGVEDEAQEQGYTLLLGNTDEDIELERQYLDTLISRRVDGVILVPAYGSSRHLQLLQDRNIPVVLLDRQVEEEADILRGDSYDGGRLLTQHLVDEGFENIAFVGGPEGVSSLEERLKGFQDVLDEAGLNSQHVHLGHYNIDSGADITRKLIDHGELPEAIVAANNYVAVGVLNELRKRDLHVPQEIALVCFDDIEAAASIDPFLTVVAQPAYEMGRQATKMLLERINGNAAPARDRTFPVELIVRRSSLNQEVPLAD